MYILFTVSNSFVSRAITNLTGEPCSHVAIQVGEFIIHSSLRGPEITTMEKFYATRRVVCRIKADRFLLHSLLQLLARTNKQGYDYLGLLYLGIRYYLRGKLGIPLPKANLWQISGMWTCTEFVSKAILGKADSMITPWKLYLLLGGKPEDVLP